MSTALMEKPVETVAVTSDQLDLVRRTVAKDATPDELKLYLYDCARQGVHPLDKLIHFTKRAGKYTPVTSIDFMRIRAAESGEYAGSDAPLYAGKEGLWGSLWLGTEPPLAAMVTVWRLVHGQRCKFEAVARWQEYKPQDNDFMWKKMPATMLAKCAEALALRKGFPRQLAGLYAKEEMDQAGESSGYVVTAPSRNVGLSPAVVVAAPTQSAGDSERRPIGAELPAEADLSAGANLTVVRVEKRPTKNANVKKYIVVLSDGREVTTIKDQIAGLAEQCAQDGDAVTVETKTTKWGEDVIALHRAMPELQLNRDLHAHDGGPDPDEPLPF